MGELECAKKLINEFCLREYGDPADFSDLRDVGLAYTEVGDEEDHPVQVDANLLDFTVKKYFDNKLVITERYDSLKEMIENQLVCLDFDELVSFGWDLINE